MTEEGKRSRLDGMRHGLTGQVSIMTDENRAAHDALRNPIIRAKHLAYSSRSAVIGSRFAARRAGTKPATTAEAARITQAAARVEGSLGSRR
jgi:hypothetical protein